MKDKIKWFAKYVGCDILFDGIACELEGVDTHTNCVIVERIEVDVKDVSLILKELKNISDEDLKECAKLGGLWMQWDLFYIYLRRLIFEDVNNFNWKVAVEITDFIRSKGYAIGIPKEYYVTNSELNIK